MLPLRVQVPFALLFGLLLGLILDPRAANLLATPPPLATPMATTASLEPFVTRADMLMATIVVRKQGPPDIVSITRLPQGRITVVGTGDSAVEVVDGSGALLYRLSFQPRFIGAGEPPKVLDEVKLSFVIPAQAGAVRIVVTTPGGVTAKEIGP